MGQHDIGLELTEHGAGADGAFRSSAAASALAKEVHPETQDAACGLLLSRREFAIIFSSSSPEASVPDGTWSHDDLVERALCVRTTVAT
jgi:hypothetical protein